ncbi:YugN family protein [Virgibacillus dokdonensis]|uniref:YugN-like family protein n=1 Tax=Virgibacillus dokdonensis TaxID=302167 RepID=A0A2K9J4D9_9BACI|nr:YugN family protein [Virgibacillus dokdonensis]AUJ25903.1 YugN-like family protein [Virgibacillus dokdonensis]
MVPIQTSLEDETYALFKLEEVLKPTGFVIGSSWEYDHGYLDIKLDDRGTYYFLRIPFKAIAGALDSPGVIVRLQQPFVLGHQYESGNDIDSRNGAVQGLVNQFQTPTDPDTDIPKEYIDMGKDYIKEVEALLIPRQEYD